MTDLRKDLLLNRWVLVAENRSERPNDYATPPATTKEGLPQDPTSCPFCPSLETQTPPAVYSACNAEGDWQVRVVPNKYPAVGTAMGGDKSGVHEVVIESPRHIQNTADLTPKELANVLEAYNARLEHWYEDGRFGYAMIFKNVHSMAGASLVHLHSQIMVLPEVPPACLQELYQLDRFRQEHDQCALCERIARERNDSVRLVLDRDGYAGGFGGRKVRLHQFGEFFDFSLQFSTFQTGLAAAAADHCLGAEFLSESHFLLQQLYYDL